MSMKIIIMENIAVIINSCEKFYKTTIPSIIESVRRTNIPMKHVYVVVGECDTYSGIIREGDYNLIFCRYVNEAYNSAIFFSQTEDGIHEINKYTHFFYTQDTTEFLPHFWEKITQAARDCDTYIKIEHKYSKNIGFFNTKWFLDNKSDLMKHYVNYDRSLILQYKDGSFPNKDEIYAKFKGLAEFLNEDCMFMHTPSFDPLGRVFQNNSKPRFLVKKYSDEDRLATVYENPGIIKYQKNWGQGGGWKLTL